MSTNSSASIHRPEARSRDMSELQASLIMVSSQCGMSYEQEGPGVSRGPLLTIVFGQWG